MRDFVVTVEGLAAKFEVLLPHLDERTRRLVVAADAWMLGRGGGRALARAAGTREATVSKGVAELKSGRVPSERVRRPGGGRKRAADLDPGLVPALTALVEPDERGDPCSPLRWTTKSLRRLAAELTAQGHKVSADVVADLLREQGFSLQAAVKTLEGKQNPDRDAQFRYINEQVKTHQDNGQPVVSVDTKKKELVGEFKNAGREWRPAGDPVEVDTHDFPGSAVGKAVPYGIYDPTTNTGWVNVGTDHDTAAFAVESLRRWWNTLGAADYPDATRLLITADAGGSNGYRTRAWKTELAALAAETGLAITVCHFPPGTSKWNTIEHRLFSHITMNWRGRPLTSHEVVLNTIAATTTATGLRVHAQLDTDTYPTGITIDPTRIEALALHRHDWHGEWNYTLAPEEPDPPTATVAAVPVSTMPAWLTHRAVTGMDTDTFTALATAVSEPRHTQRETALHRRRRGERQTAPGCSRPATLTLGDRVAITLLHNRFGLTNTDIATLLDLHPNTVYKLVRQTRTLLEAIDHHPDPAPPITTLDEFTAYLTTNGAV